MNHEHGHEQRGSGSTFRAKWVFIAFVAIAAYFLITEHRAHLSGYLNYLPLLLLLACPLLHMFMHGGHGGHGSRDGHRDHGATKERNPS
jgi:hypothetical protein